MLSAPLVPGGTTQSRFTALRQFALYTCDSTQGSDCSVPASYTLAFTSPANAFPGELPRPLAPELIISHWKVRTQATDIMLKVLNNPCTGGPQYQGEQDNDPSNNTDCTSGSANGQTVHAAELQIFKAAAFVTVLSNHPRNRKTRTTSRRRRAPAAAGRRSLGASARVLRGTFSSLTPRMGKVAHGTTRARGRRSPMGESTATSEANTVDANDSGARDTLSHGQPHGSHL